MQNNVHHSVFNSHHIMNRETYMIIEGNDTLHRDNESHTSSNDYAENDHRLHWICYSSRTCCVYNTRGEVGY